MIDKRLLGFPAIRTTMTLLAVLSFIQGLAIAAQAYGLTSSLVEVWKLRQLNALLMPAALFFVAFAVRQLSEVAKQKIATSYADRIVSELRPKVHRKLFMNGPIPMASRGTGASVTLSVDGLDQVKTYIQTVLPKMMDITFIPVIVLVLVFAANWLSGVVLIMVLPLLLFFMAILGMAARDKSNQQYGEFRTLNNRFVDTILGLPTLKMLGVSESYESEMYTVSERFRKRTMSVIMVAMSSTFALDFFTTLSIAVVAVFLGTNLINGTIALFPALLALIAAPEYFLPIRQFGNDYHATLNGKNALQEMMTLLDSPEPERIDTLEWSGWSDSSSLSVRNVDFVRTRQESGQNQMPPENTAQQVSSHKQPKPVKTSETTPILQKISFEARGNETIAVIGRSGAGKSTLINMLAGFNLPQHGSFALDGKLLPHLNASAWQSHISYIPQDPYIFHGSIADNIRFYVPQADDTQVAAAAETAGLTAWLETLPEGLATQIGEGNRGISGGQAQRIALARAVIDTSREILLLDEPTAHLDIETEYDLKQTLVPIMRNHLVIFATHRLHWLDTVDQVLVLEGGSVVQSGTPAGLIGSGGALDELIREMGGNHMGGNHMSGNHRGGKQDD